MSIAYFLYLFLFSGLEYSLTFHVHQRFNYTRYSDVLSLSFVCVDWFVYCAVVYIAVASYPGSQLG